MTRAEARACKALLHASGAYAGVEAVVDRAPSGVWCVRVIDRRPKE